MSALFGFIVGYVVGARAGNDGFDKLEEAWREIRRSDEFRSLLELARSHLSGTLKTVGERLQDDSGTILTDIEERAAAARARLSQD